VTGSLALDPKNSNAAKVDVIIPMSKVMCAGLTQHLLRPGKDGAKADFFGANLGDAHFVSTKVVATGSGLRSQAI
jgi:polyisoprenoid-binding protein YceI